MATIAKVSCFRSGVNLPPLDIDVHYHDAFGHSCATFELQISYVSNIGFDNLSEPTVVRSVGGDIMSHAA